MELQYINNIELKNKIELNDREFPDCLQEFPEEFAGFSPPNLTMLQLWEETLTDDMTSHDLIWGYLILVQMINYPTISSRTKM